MTGQTGYNATPIDKIVVRGDPLAVIEKEVETATNMYPGRLVKSGTTEVEAVVSDAISPVIGWISHEHGPDRKDSLDTIYTTSDRIAVIRGRNMSVRATMAPGFVCKMGDYVIPWSSGQVAPAIMLPGGRLAVRTYFVNTSGTTEADTSCDIPTGVMIGVPEVYAISGASSASLSVGMGMSTEAGYDVDGLLKSISISSLTNTWATIDVANTTTVTENIGALLAEAEGKDAQTSANYFMYLKTLGLVCDGTLVSICYTPSNHAMSGYIYVPVNSEGIKPVGYAAHGLSKSTSAQNLIVESLI